MESDKLAAKAKFLAELKGLNCNSKPIITSLTRLADEYIRYAGMVVECVESHLWQVKVELKLAVMYLIDSIVKNIKRDYVSLFSTNIVSTFTKTFEQLAKLDQVSKAKMMKLRNTWTDIFPESKLSSIDCICKLLDPDWTVQHVPLVSKHNHVNRKNVSRAGTKGSLSSSSYGDNSSLPVKRPQTSITSPITSLNLPSQNVDGEVDGVTELHEQLLLKQKQLLELQTQKLKLEVLQAQVQLEEKTREKSDFDSTYLNQVLLQQAETARQKTQLATSLLSGIVPTSNTNLAPAHRTAVAPSCPHQEIVLPALPTVTPPLSTEHISEPYHVRNSPKLETAGEAPAILTVKASVSSKPEKPYYNGYDPSNIYDKTLSSGSVVARDRGSSVSPESSKVILSDKLEDYGDGNRVEVLHKHLGIEVDMDTQSDDSFGHSLSKENFGEAKVALKRASTTGITDINSIQKSKTDQCPSLKLGMPYGVHSPLTNSMEFESQLGPSADDYPPLKKQRKSEKQEGISPINDLFGGKDVDLRKPSEPMLRSGTSKAFNSIPVKDYPVGINVGLNNEEIDPQQLPASLVLSSDPRRRPPNEANTPSEFVGTVFDKKPNGQSPLPSMQDEMRNNQNWNQPLLAKSISSHGVLGSSNYNTGITSGGLRMVGPGTGMGMSPGNPWMESKSGNVWSASGPGDPPYGNGNGPNHRFTGSGWVNQPRAAGPGLAGKLWSQPQPLGPNPFEEALSHSQPRGFVEHCIPRVNMADYETICKDISGTVPIDGVLRKVRFYGETAVVLQGVNGDEPRELSFRADKEFMNVYIDKEREPLRCFFDKSTPFFLNRQKHFLKLGAPTREIYVDGSHYEASFGGEPIFVRIDGAMHSITLEGPPPKVLVGKTLRNDLVAGRLNLCLDGRLEDIFLDEKPQLYELPYADYPLILLFCDGFRTLKINGRPFPAGETWGFGGPPVTVTVPGVARHTISLSALHDSTRKCMLRYVKSHSTTATINSNIQTTATGTDNALQASNDISKTCKPILSDANVNLRLSPNPPFSNKEIALSEYPPGTSPVATADNFDMNARARSPGSKPSLDEFCHNSTESMSSKTEGETSKSSAIPKKMEFSVGDSANLNVQDLLHKLKAAGLLPAAPTGTDSPEKSALEAEHAEKSKSTEVPVCVGKGNAATKSRKVPRQRSGAQSGGKRLNDTKQEIQITPLEVVDITFAQLKQRIPAVVAQIWTGTQCSSCGLRFPPDQSQKFSEHLDWHFRNNRKVKARGKKICRREFYYKISDWMQYSEFEDREDRARSMFELQAEEQALHGKNKDGEKAWMNPNLLTAPCAGHEGAICPQCGEGFETYFDEDKEEWRFREACLSYDEEEDNHTRRAYHILCYKDLLASLEGKSILSYVVTTSNENESEHKNKTADTTTDDADEIVILKEGKKEITVMDIVDIDEEQSVVPPPSKEATFHSESEKEDGVMEIVDEEQQQSLVISPLDDNSSLAKSQSVAQTEALDLKGELETHDSTSTDVHGKITSSSPLIVDCVDHDLVKNNSSSDSDSIATASKDMRVPAPNAMTNSTSILVELEKDLKAKDNEAINNSPAKEENPNDTDTSTMLSCEEQKAAVATTEEVVVDESSTGSPRSENESTGVVSIVKIDLTEDDDDVMEVSSSASASHALSTIEGNIPLNGHTPLNSKVASAGSIRIRIQDALLQQERARSPKLASAEGSAKEDTNCSTDQAVEMQIQEGEQNSSRNSSTCNRDDTSTPTSSNSNVPNTCTSTNVTTDVVDIIEDENEKRVINVDTSDSSVNKSKSFPHTKFTDFPPRVSGKETSGLCVIS